MIIYRKFIQVLLLLSFVLASCGGGGGSSGSSPSPSPSPSPTPVSASNLTFITPVSVPQVESVTLPSQIYVVVENPLDETITNISYSITNQVGSGNAAELESGAVCSTIVGGGQCVLKVSVPYISSSGSFQISATNSVSVTQKLFNKVLLWIKPSLADASSEANSFDIATGDTVPVTSNSNADGISLSYYNKVVAGTQSVIVTGVVNSSNPGSYNNIVLVNSNGTPLPNQQ